MSLHVIIRLPGDLEDKVRQSAPNLDLEVTEALRWSYSDAGLFHTRSFLAR